MGTLTGFGSLSAIPEEKISDKITRRVLAGQKGMMVWWKIGAGTHVATHSHPHEQLVWMLKGRMEFRAHARSWRHRRNPRRRRSRGLVPRGYRGGRHIRTAARGFFGRRRADVAAREVKAETKF